MNYTAFGTTGLRVSQLALGTGTFGTGWGHGASAEDSAAIFNAYAEAGGNFIDTADVYSNGASEEVLGEAIKGRRDKVLISTKTTLPMGDGPNDAGSSRSRLIKAAEDALRRLGTDHIDLLQLHAFDAGTPVEEVL